MHVASVRVLRMDILGGSRCAVLVVFCVHRTDALDSFRAYRL